MSVIEHNIEQIRKRIYLAAQEHHLSHEAITLLAASKTRTADEIRTAVLAGIKHIGENRVQEALEKQPDLQDLDITWHMIGPVQSNKTRLVAEHFDWVHSLDTERTANRLDRQRPAGVAPLNVCIQVNISGEQSKSGIARTVITEFAHKIDNLPRLRLRGLMAIPDPDPEATEQAFQAMHDCYIRLQEQFPEIDTLSMGMSDDFETAIIHGATLLRLGSALFGPRG